MSITKTPLGKDLTQGERIYLASLAHHDGFPVLQKLFDDACRAATEEVMKVDPASPNYKDVLAAKQANARAIHEFCDAIRKSFNWNVEIGVQEVEKEAAKEEKRRSPN